MRWHIRITGVILAILAAGTSIAAIPDLTVTKSHVGNFTQGDAGRIYTIIVRNIGASSTSGAVTVTDTLPAGLTATAMSGTGWSCTLGTLTCTRSDALAASSNYSPIKMTVDVANNASPAVTNGAVVSGGGETNTANDAASDYTVIWSQDTCPNFGPSRSVPGQNFPLGSAVGDFNSDGKLDLAVAEYYGHTVAVLIGVGDGTFAPAVQYPVGQYPAAVVAGDVNNDGKIDLAVASGFTDNASVLLGNGDGTFAAAVGYAAGDTPVALALGDFNNDANLDLVVVNSSSNDVSILLGNGDGSFQAAVNKATGTNPRSVAVSDFNADGNADLVVANGSGGVLIFLGAGSGSFPAGVSYPAGTNTTSVAVGDLNGDGKPDLAVTNASAGTVSTLRNNGDGTFQSPVSHSLSYGADFVVIDDINGDRNPDLVVGNTVAPGIFFTAVAMLLGNGDGTFPAPIYEDVVSYTDRITVGDFNADGRADLVLSGGFTSTIQVLPGGCSDLTIAKTHTGDFIPGNSYDYAITVTNSGNGSTRGTVTVTDTIPAGLTATAMSGLGWTCDLPTTTCTRTTALAAGAAYPQITLTVSVSYSAPPTVTNIATVAGGGDHNGANNTASDPTTIIREPDFTITKTHTGTFAQGETGRTYIIVVGNGGTAATSGLATVTDALPASLTPTALSGTGWTCNLGSRTCTRSDALDVNMTYPPITLTVNVSSDAPSTVTNVATASGGGTLVDRSANDVTHVITTPMNLVATAISTSEVSVNWSEVPYATAYQVYRSSNHGSFALVAAPVTNSFVDSLLTPGTTFVYIVRATDPYAAGPFSNPDVATTILFTDDPIVAGETIVKALHITELRTAVNAVRAAAGLSATTFTDTPLMSGTIVMAVHLSELKMSLDEARSALALPAVPYSDTLMVPGAPIKAAHVRDLRSGVK